MQVETISDRVLPDRERQEVGGTPNDNVEASFTQATQDDEPAEHVGGKNDCMLSNIVKAGRCSKTKVEREAAKGGKAGHPGRFHGEILAYLESNVEAYKALPSKGNPARGAALSTFWREVVFDGFWNNFALSDVEPLVQGHEDMRPNKIIEIINDVSRYYVAHV